VCTRPWQTLWRSTRAPRSLAAALHSDYRGCTVATARVQCAVENKKNWSAPRAWGRQSVTSNACEGPEKFACKTQSDEWMNVNIPTFTRMQVRQKQAADAQKWQCCKTEKTDIKTNLHRRSSHAQLQSTQLPRQQMEGPATWVCCLCQSTTLECLRKNQVSP
jgi:hypothetical protein